MRTPLLLLFLLGAISAMAQEYRISATLRGAGNSRIMLAAFDDLDYHVVDTAWSDAQGKVEFRLDARTPHGMYRLYSRKDMFTDFIFCGEEVELAVDPSAQGEPVKVKRSEENKGWYAYLATEKDVMGRLELITPVVDYYPAGTLKDSALAEFVRQQQRLSAAVLSLCNRKPGGMACHMAAIRKPPALLPSIPPAERLPWMQKHYFDGLNMNDTLVLRSTVYADKVIDYIGLYADRNLTQSQLEDKFTGAIDTLMTYVDPASPVYSYIVQYLVNGFERYKFEKVLAHIAENYMSQFSCEDEDQKKAVEKRLESFRRMAAGKPVPAFSVPDVQGNPISLAQLKAPYHLIVFWSSQCPHCVEMLPELSRLFQGSLRERMDILAVSLDTDRKAWLDVLSGGDYPWVHASELKGWQSKIANDFHIYATPTLILTDRQGTILAKPITLPELRTELRQKGIIE
ncbi:MAG TPA: thioredoxin-like domain-containing protein [Bacteroidales bacterium]|nr:thioredoxin-like domain-containing protein [Bacteroidales bacterium]HRZ76353.1 thioredoxin-like domain-containing protein [Bacteroidales bacterium]